MALRGRDPNESDLTDESVVGHALSGTFATRGPRVRSEEGIATTAEAERLIRAFLLGTAHEQSSPLGALLANLSLARDDLDGLLSEGRVINESVGASLHTLRQDLDDALNIVGRLRRLGEHMKRLAIKDESCDFDLRELIPLATVVVSSYGTPRVPVRYLFEPSTGESHSWVVSVPGVRFVIALVQVVSELVQTSDEPVQCVRLTARTTELGPQVALELEYRHAEPESGTGARRAGTSRHDFLIRLELLLRESNFRVIRQGTQPGVRVELESIGLGSAASL